MQPYNKNSASTGDYRGLKSVLDERVIEGLEHTTLSTDLQLVYNSPKTIVVDSFISGQIILPDATTLEKGWLVYLINNDSASNITVSLFASAGTNPVFNEIEPLKMIQCLLLDNTTEAGTWKLVGTGEFGTTELEKRYVTSVYDTVNISYGEIGVGNEYTKTLTTIPLDTPVKSIFIKPTERFVGADVYLSLGTEEEPTKFYNNVPLSGAITPNNYTKDLFEEILSTTTDTNLIAKLYTLHSSDNPWVVKNSGTVNDIERAYYCNGLFAFVTSTGDVQTTTDFNTFNSRSTSAFSFHPKSILVLNNYFYIAAKKDGVFTIVKTADFNSFTYYATSINVDSDVIPFGLAKCGNSFISTMKYHTIYGTDLEDPTTWDISTENLAFVGINNVVATDEICLINCEDFYFTTSNGYTLAQHDNSTNYYYDYLDEKWVRYYKHSLTDYNLEYSYDLANWMTKDTQTLNIYDIQVYNGIWFVFTYLGQYQTELSYSRDFFTTITREDVGFGSDAINCAVCTDTQVVVAGEGGNIGYSTGDTFLTLSSGMVKIVVEKIREINPQTIKNPIINTQVPVGTIFNYPFTELPEGYYRLDGSHIPNIRIVSEQFLNKLLKSVQDGAANLFISNEAHLQRGGDSQVGWGYFSWVDDTRKDEIRLPKISHFIRGLGSMNDLAQIGTFTDDTMRRIWGEAGDWNHWCMDGRNVYSGAFGSFTIPNRGRGPKSGGDDNYARMHFDSALLGANYNGSETQPKHYKFPYIISVYNAVQETATINLTTVSQMIEENNKILDNMYKAIAGINATKSSPVRQCVSQATNDNFCRVLNGLTTVVDAEVWGTCAQGYISGLPNDVIMHTYNQMQLTLPANASGVIYLEKNITTNSVTVNYTSAWFEQPTKPSGGATGNFWYDTKHEILYKFTSPSNVTEGYAVKLADFTTNGSAATVYPVKLNYPGKKGLGNWVGIAQTGTAIEDGFIVVSSSWNGVASITIDGITRAYVSPRDKYGQGVVSCSAPIARGSSWSLEGATLYFIPIYSYRQGGWY